MAGRTTIFSRWLAGIFSGAFVAAIGIAGGMGIYMLLIYSLQGGEIDTATKWGWTSLLAVMILGGPIAGIFVGRSISRNNHRRAVSVIVIWSASVPTAGITAALAAAVWSATTHPNFARFQENTEQPSLREQAVIKTAPVEFVEAKQKTSSSEPDLLLTAMNPMGPDSDTNDLTPHFNYQNSETKYVAADVLRLRSSPSADSEHLANLRYGDNVQARDILGQEGGEWVQVIAQLDGPHLLSRAWGYAPRRFLVEAGDLKGPDQIKAAIDLAESDRERLVWAERLYAAEPSDANLVRLRNIVSAQGDADRVEQLTNLLRRGEGNNLAVCHEGELIWLQGGPYTNDVWRGNYHNVRGHTALEIIRRTYQSQPWYQPTPPGEPVSYETDRRIRWPWRISTTRVVDPETLGYVAGQHNSGPGYVTAAWNTRYACAFGGPHDFFANYPIVESSLEPVALTKELQALVREHNRKEGAGNPMTNGADARAYVISSAPEYVVVAYGLSGDDSPAYDTVLILDKVRNNVRLEMTESGGERKRIDRLSVVQNGKTNETYLIARERQPHQPQDDGAIGEVKVLTVYSLTSDGVTRSGQIPVSLKSIYPHTLASPERASDETYHRKLNDVPEPEPLKRPQPPARRIRDEADRLPVDAPVAALFDHWLSNTVWKPLNPRWTSVVKFFRTDARDDRTPLEFYLPALDSNGQETGRWVRLKIGAWENDWNGAVVPALTIGEHGYYPERLPAIAYGKGVVELAIYGKSGSLHRITPLNDAAVFVELPQGDMLRYEEHSHRDVLISAQDLYPIGEKRPVMRVAPSDNAEIIPETHTGIFAESSYTDNTTHLFPIPRQEDNDDWIRVKRITYAKGDAPIFLCGEVGPEPLQVSEGWIRWRSKHGDPKLSFSNGVTC